MVVDNDDEDDDNAASTPPVKVPTPFSGVPRLAYVEVESIPPSNQQQQRRGGSLLNSAMVKQQLMDWSVQSLLLPKSSKFVIDVGVGVDSDHCELWSSNFWWQPVLVHHANGTRDEILWLESSDPLHHLSHHIPVKCRGYVVSPFSSSSSLSESQPHPAAAMMQVMVDESTLVRVVEHDTSLAPHTVDWKLQLTGEAPEVDNTATISSTIGEDEQCTVLLLWDESVRMQLQNREIGRYMVGTAKTCSIESTTLPKYNVRASLDAYYNKHHYHHEPHNTNNNNPLLVIQDEASSSSSSPQDVVKLCKAACRTDVCHVVRWGALRAKYGVHADWGLACSIHSIAIYCAVRNRSCTIILVDCWDNNSSKDDDDNTNARLQQYLDRLIDGLKRHQTIVFPEENPLYGMNHGTSGVRLSVRLNLIAIASAGALNRHDGTKKRRSNVDYLIVPCAATIETRLRGLQYALAEAENADERLSDIVELRRLAETVGWARGSVFERIRHRVSLVQQRDQQLSFARFEAILGEFGPVTPSTANSQERAGGNDRAKQALEDAMNPEVELESLGLSAPTGILLYGPPGTGKTLLAKSLSRSMIVLHSTDVAQSTVGQGEKAVLEAFENARKRSERVTVIFIDEFQALFTDRSSFGGSSRVTTTLFQCMDNLSRWRKVDDSRRIIVLAATNTPWMIDPAFLRPGRFDRTVYVGLPSCKERKSILSLHLQSMQIDDDLEQLSDDLALRSDGFSGADLAALCRAAAVQRLLDGNNSSLKVQKRHFADVLEEKIVGPSSDPGLLARIEAWRRS